MPPGGDEAGPRNPRGWRAQLQQAPGRCLIELRHQSRRGLVATATERRRPGLAQLCFARPAAGEDEKDQLGCILEILGPAPDDMARASPRSSTFFNTGTRAHVVAGARAARGGCVAGLPPRSEHGFPRPRARADTGEPLAATLSTKHGPRRVGTLALTRALGCVVGRDAAFVRFLQVPRSGLFLEWGLLAIHAIRNEACRSGPKGRRLPELRWQWLAGGARVGCGGFAGAGVRAGPLFSSREARRPKPTTHCGHARAPTARQACLRWTPEFRLTPRQALRHDWILEG